MWVGWYTTHGAKSRSTLENAKTPVSTPGEKAASVGRLLSVYPMWHMLPL